MKSYTKEQVVQFLRDYGESAIEQGKNSECGKEEAKQFAIGDALNELAHRLEIDEIAI